MTNGRRLLLDAHVVVWWATGSDLLPNRTVAAIGEANDVVVSLVSLWEIVLKEATSHPMVGTSDAHRWFADALSSTDFTTLSIQARHIGAVQHLPARHRDPFDRLLVAQAMDTGHTLVSRDRQLRAYDVDVGWWR